MLLMGKMVRFYHYLMVFNMKQLQVKLKFVYDNSYPIFIGASLANDFIDILKNHYEGRQIVLVSDKRIPSSHVDKLIEQLQGAGYYVLAISLRLNEALKNNKTKQRVEAQMFEHKIMRNCLCIALGGGVIGDIVGYLASTYMRGVKYMQIPTTLLSMLDSSVGGKTGINTKYGKNLIGSFYQPKLVFMDMDFLDSLPKKQLINGLIEAIKIFLTFDKEAFQYLVENIDNILAYDKVVLQNIIEKAVALKAYVVENDEHEANLRMVLNFGHTIGHGIELVSKYKIMHGIAIAIGIIVESYLAVRLGKLAKEDFIIIEQLMCKLGINIDIIEQFDMAEIANATLLDKKNIEAGTAKYVLLNEIGKIAYTDSMVATSVSCTDILSVLNEIKQR